jgi:hypothetical protein
MAKSKHIWSLISVAAGIMILLSTTLNNEQKMELKTLSEEIEAIRAAAQLYVDGIKYADASKIDQVFHADWNMTGFYEDGNYRHFDRNGFLQLIERNRENADFFPRYEGGIVDVYHYGKTAVVKVRVENERVIFTDYLSLLKIEGEWKIIHKIWDTELQNG